MILIKIKFVHFYFSAGVLQHFDFIFSSFFWKIQIYFLLLLVFSNDIKIVLKFHVDTTTTNSYNAVSCERNIR